MSCRPESTHYAGCDCREGQHAAAIYALEAQLAALSELFPCGCRKIDMDNSYGDCIFCGFRKGYEEYEEENEELEAKLSDSNDAIEHLRVSEAEREGTEEKLRKELAEVTAERDRLRAWKDDAMHVESTWDSQKVGNLLGLGLGESIHRNIQPGIERLLAAALTYTAGRTEK